MCCRLANQVFGRHPKRSDPGLLQLSNMARSDSAPLLDQHGVADTNIKTGQLAAEPLRYQLKRDLIAGQMKDVMVKKQLQHFAGLHTQSAEQDSDRQLPPAIDAGVQQILGIKLEIQPRSPIRNDPRRIEDLAGRVRLAAVMIEKDTRRAMHLGNNHPLRTVDHERPILGHERQFAHVDFLLLDFFRNLVGRRAVLVEQNESHLHSERGRIGNSPLLTFLDVERRFAEPIVHVFQPRVTRIALDWKNRLERRMNPSLLTLCGWNVELQKLAIGIKLYRQQVRHFLHCWQLGEILAKTLFFGERVRHGIIPRRFCRPAEERRRSRKARKPIPITE